MQFLVNKSFPVLNCDLSRSRQESTVLYYRQPKISNYACPYCSYTLLRHLSLEGIFWRCSHCYQSMQMISTDRKN